MANNHPGTIVITGAGGFVGSALVAHCVATGRPFVEVARKLPARGGAHPQAVEVADLATASDRVLDAIVAGAAAIVHLAGRAHVLTDAAQDSAALYHAANVVALERIAAAAVRGGVRRFVLASTIKVTANRRFPAGRFARKTRWSRGTRTREASSPPRKGLRPSRREPRSKPSYYACRSSTDRGSRGIS
jgi:nucleoside-diphosphate-sugar epimerase